MLDPARVLFFHVTEYDWLLDDAKGYATDGLFKTSGDYHKSGRFNLLVHSIYDASLSLKWRINNFSCFGNIYIITFGILAPRLVALCTSSSLFLGTRDSVLPT